MAEGAGGVSLLDAQTARQRFPGSVFREPTAEDIAAIAPGDFIELCFAQGGDVARSERLWICVTGPGRGELSNVPRVVDLTTRALVAFEPRHVISIVRHG